jgi:hypothetical protein
MLIFPKRINIKLACLLGGHVIDEVAARYGYPICSQCGENLYEMEAGYSYDYPTLDLWRRWWDVRYWLFSPRRVFVRLTRRWRCAICDGWETKDHDCIPF